MPVVGGSGVTVAVLVATTPVGLGEGGMAGVGVGEPGAGVAGVGDAGDAGVGVAVPEAGADVAVGVGVRACASGVGVGVSVTPGAGVACGVGSRVLVGSAVGVNVTGSGAESPPPYGEREYAEALDLCNSRPLRQVDGRLESVPTPVVVVLDDQVVAIAPRGDEVASLESHRDLNRRGEREWPIRTRGGGEIEWTADDGEPFRRRRGLLGREGDELKVYPAGDGNFHARGGYGSRTVRLDASQECAGRVGRRRR